ncbi:DNA repair protein [Pasteurellaceae bacterium 22721_9_1]
MFVQNLNTQQQSVLLSLAQEIIAADSNLTDAETAMLEILKSQANPDAKASSVDLANLSTIFTTNKEKHSLLLELLGIAHADNEYHLDEKDLISSYAKHLNVSPETLNELEFWVEKQIALSVEIEMLLS